MEKSNIIEWTPSSMLEVTLNEPDDFLKVRETLTRIGVASRKENKLFQSCHILHKQGRYFIVHFKELFLLDGKKSNLEENDVARRNTIAQLMSDWGLITIENTKQLGLVLYTDFIIYFQLAGIVLLIAMLGAIVLTHQRRKDVKKQDILTQIYRDPDNSIELKDIKPGQGL